MSTVTSRVIRALAHIEREATKAAARAELVRSGQGGSLLDAHGRHERSYATAYTSGYKTGHLIATKIGARPDSNMVPPDLKNVVATQDAINAWALLLGVPIHSITAGDQVYMIAVRVYRLGYAQGWQHGAVAAPSKDEFLADRATYINAYAFGFGHGEDAARDAVASPDDEVQTPRLGQGTAAGQASILGLALGHVTDKTPVYYAALAVYHDGFKNGWKSMAQHIAQP